MDPAPASPATYAGAPEEKSFVQTGSAGKWMVTPDLGELDDHSTLWREWDSPDYLNKMKPKFSGWSNPLSWTDGGEDDDVVLFQMKSKLNFDESGFDTPADKGLDDDRVVNFVQIKVHDDEDGEDDINTALNLTNQDMRRKPEDINIENNAKADNGLDDDQIV